MVRGEDLPPLFQDPVMVFRSAVSLPWYSAPMAGSEIFTVPPCTATELAAMGLAP
jgi:hypothetical protein